MNKKTFRILLILSIALAVLSLVSGFYFPDENIQKVNDYILEVEGSTDVFTLEEIWRLTLSAIILVAVIASYIGLFLFKLWGRHLFVASFVFATPSYFMGGLYVSSGLESWFYDASMLLSGGLAALMYFSPIKVHFLKNKYSESSWSE